MCIQLRQTGVLCLYNSIDDSIGMNIDDSMVRIHTHTHIEGMEVTALHNVTSIQYTYLSHDTCTVATFSIDIYNSTVLLYLWFQVSI